MGAESLWPPTGAQSELLARLALLIERGGAAHFLDTPVVRTDARDFPEPWQPTAVAVERLLVRLLWLTHVDLDVALDDRRRYDVRGLMIRRSDISWVATAEGVAHFQIDAIGNDDVAGLLCHEVGLAYAAWLDCAAAYRGTPTPPSARDGSIAAIYLGLGVIATNAALYNMVAGKMEGQMSVTETQVIQIGGLAPAEAIYLLAIQAVVRDRAIDAHSMLRADLRAGVARAEQGLRPYRAAIAAHLGLDLAAPRAPLERDPSPPVVALTRAEPSKTTRFVGERTYRLASTDANAHIAVGALGGALTGGAIFALSGQPLVLIATIVIPMIAGAIIGAGKKFDRCVRCAVIIPAAANDCPGCGATVAGRLRNAGEFAARELEAGDDTADQGDDAADAATPPPSR